jgi:hypothetical protein
MSMTASCRMSMTVFFRAELLAEAQIASGIPVLVARSR